MENLEMEKALIGWSSWWNKRELEEETEKRKSRLREKRRNLLPTSNFQTRYRLDGKWWVRVEADGKKEG
jgi:hypothetical protein